MGDDTNKAQGSSAKRAPINKSGASRARRKNARQAPISTPPRTTQQRDLSLSQRRMVQRRLRERSAAQAAEANTSAPVDPEVTEVTTASSEEPVNLTAAPSPTEVEHTAAAKTPIARLAPEIGSDFDGALDADAQAPLTEAYEGRYEDQYEDQYANLDESLSSSPERPLEDADMSAEAASPHDQAIQPRNEHRRLNIGKRYVRKRAPHKTQAPIDDLAPDDTSIGNYTHDSNVAVGGATPLSGMVYRRSRSNMPAFQRNLQYGQYLQIPKGRRAIFASRERAQRRRSVLSLLIVIALLVVAAILIASLMRDAIANLE